MVSADVPPALRHGSPSPLVRIPFADIPRVDWDRLHAITPGATPFSTWTFHRAWWDAFAGQAEEQYLVLGRADADAPLDPSASAGTLSAIVPLMVREAQEPPSVVSPTSVVPPDPAAGSATEPGARLEPSAGRWLRTSFFGASYHADYATLLAAHADLPSVAATLVGYLGRWLAAGAGDAVDLRRLAETDPARDLLAAAWREVAPGLGLQVRLEVEDVCPVVDLAGDWHAQLGQLDKKTRHEIRRKLRRAEREGHVELRYLPLDGGSAARFVRLHQARWGSAGLFAPGEDGDRNRLFLRRLAELEGAEGADGGAGAGSAEGAGARFHLAEVTVGGRVVHALAGFADEGTCYFYNAGMDPEARDLSPGIVGTAAYLRDRLDRGDRRFDFLRGDEAYKYEWGARDTRLWRLVVERATAQ